MAQVVVGVGASHGSLVSLAPEWWPAHGELDVKRVANFAELAEQNGARLEPELQPEVWQRKYEATQAALGVVAGALRSAQPDVLVIIGDDQAELFQRTSMPAMAVYWGESVDDIPRDMTNVPPSRAAAMWAHHAETRETYPVQAELGKHIIESLIRMGFDITQLEAQPEGRSIGHAFTFVRLRLMGERMIPIVPIMLNTYFPPNQPTAVRCFALGRALRTAIESWPADKRVAVIGSGGLSHFRVDEELDRAVLDYIANDNRASLCGIPEDRLQSGSSEIKNWIVAAAALDGFKFQLVDYQPGYRSPAGTGCGMAFAHWS